jgi:putative transposase
MPKLRKSSPRLQSFDYTGPFAYFVTCSTYHKRRYFKYKAVVEPILSSLIHSAIQHSFTIYAYCFMPDHLYILLLGDAQSSLHKVMKTFKQETSFKFRENSNQPLWQRSYYDHILRKEEALQEVALYILNNPVRKGLLDDYQKYPFCSCLVLDTPDIE